MGPSAAASGFTTAASPRFLPIPCGGMRLLTRVTASCCPAPSISTCTSANPAAPTGKDGVQAVAPLPPAGKDCGGDGARWDAPHHDCRGGIGEGAGGTGGVGGRLRPMGGAHHPQTRASAGAGGGGGAPGSSVDGVF